MKAKKIILGLILTVLLLSLACKHPAPLKLDAAAPSALQAPLSR